MEWSLLHESVDAVRSARQSVASIVASCFERIQAIGPSLECFRELYEREAGGRASDLDNGVAQKTHPGPLAGALISVKDNIVADFGTSCGGSRILENYRSPFSATALQRLLDAGAVIIGKTNCDEFGMGSSGEHCAFGSTRNPWDLERVPGGSSSGAAAAVAAGLGHAALASDSGGSVRQPAAMCGVVGLKPTYGRVSRYGLITYGSSLDQVGPIARSVTDAALILQTIAGVDPQDATSADRSMPDLLAEINEPIADLRLGVPRQYRHERNHSEVARLFEEAIDVYRALGATIVDVDLPLTEHGIATYYVIAPAEASSNLARFDGIRYGRRADAPNGATLDELYIRSRSEGFGPEVRQRIMLGTYVLSAGYYDAYFDRAMRARRLIREEFDRAFAQCHAILGPTSPVPAFRRGEKLDPLSMYLCDVYTTSANLAGHCAISIPCGLAEENGSRLPVGLQIQCPSFDEMTLVRIARQFERATTHARQTPPLATSPAP